MANIYTELSKIHSQLTATSPLSYSVGQVADFLKCEKAEIESQLTSGSLPGIKFGEDWIIPAQVFVSYLNALAMTQAHERRMSLGAQAIEKIEPTNHAPPVYKKLSTTKKVNNLISEEELIELSGIVYNNSPSSKNKYHSMAAWRRL